MSTDKEDLTIMKHVKLLFPILLAPMMLTGCYTAKEAKAEVNPQRVRRAAAIAGNIQNVSINNWDRGYADDHLVEHMFDDDESTFCWFQKPISETKPNIVIELKNAVILNNLYLKHAPNTDDYLWAGTFLYSNDGKDFTEIGRFKKSGEDEKQHFYVAAGGVSAKYIQLIPTDATQWVQIGELGYNSLDVEEEANSFEVIGKDGDTVLSLYSGTTLNMFVDSELNGGWYQGHATDVTVDMKSVKHVMGLDISTGKIAGGDDMAGEIQYSINGTDFTKYDDYSVTHSSSANFDARYVRITNTKIGWSSIKKFLITTSKGTTVLQSGLTLVPDKNDLYKIIDDDLDTILFADWHFESGSYVQVLYSNAVLTNNIVFLQGGNNGNSSEDKFSSSVLSYSSDGVNWTDLTTYSGSFSNLYEFDEPTLVKAIKMTYNGESASATGVVIREFNVNYVKHDLSASLISDCNYSNDSYAGHGLLPFDSGLTITYTNLRTKISSTAVPTEISEYSVRLQSAGNAAYNACDITTKMTVNDSANNLESDFLSLLNNGSICSAITTQADEIKSLAYRHENCLSSSEKAAFDAKTFKNSENEDMLIADALAYAKAKVESNKNNNGKFMIADDVNKGTSAINIVALIVAFCFIPFMLYYIVKRRKHN